MTAQIIRLLILIGLIMMPFTMNAAPAQAHAMPAMSDGHCDDEQAPDAPQQMQLAKCMLMCAALPAAEMPAISPPEVPNAPRRIAFDDPVQGITLEIATPPPRPA